jgi:hypothetical protein
MPLVGRNAEALIARHVIDCSEMPTPDCVVAAHQIAALAPKVLAGDSPVRDASPAAAYRYLHVVDGRDAEIAAALSELAKDGTAAKLPRSIVVRNNGAL